MGEEVCNMERRFVMWTGGLVYIEEVWYVERRFAMKREVWYVERKFVTLIGHLM